MTNPMPSVFRRRGRPSATGAAATAALVLLSALAACSTDSLLAVEDPDIINPSNLDSPSAARALRNGAIDRFRNITGAAESTWLFGGLLTDEWSTSSTFVQNDETDQRDISIQNSSITGMFRRLNQVRTAANQAIAGFRTYYPDSSAAIAELYFARGFAEMQLAQDFCGAIPLSDAAGASVMLAGPSTTAEVFAVSIASYDSALALVGTATAGTPQSIARAARIGKGRALLGLGRYAEAATAVAGIPTSYSYTHTFATTSGDNVLWSQPASSRRYTVGDSLEGNAHDLLVKNAIPFFSAKDPRLPVVYTVSSSGKDTTKAQDGFTFSRTTPLYARSTPVAVVNGIDARLIEAEAALQANNPAGMLAILNALRAAPPTIGTVTPTAASLPPLTLPATRDGQIDLLFREKAFWTFSRGQRLGDLRRLIRQYNRPATAVFPEGAHYRGGVYGTDVNLPVPQQEENNPNFGSAGRQQCKQDQA